MKLYCPHCGVKGSADDSYSGRKVKCPKCQGRFLAQSEMALESPAPLAPAPEEVLGQQDAMDLADFLDQLPDESDIFPEQDELPVGNALQELDAEAVELISDDFGDDSDIFEELDSLETIDPEETSLQDEAGLEEILGTEIEEIAEDSLDGIDITDGLDLPEDDFEDMADITDEEFSEGIDDVTDADTGEIQDVSGEDVDEDVAAGVDTLDEDEESTWLEEESDEPADSEDEVDEKLEQTDEQDRQNEGNRSHLAYLTTSEPKEEIYSEDEVEQEPYGIDKEQCWECGKDAGDEVFTPREGRLYCDDCLPEEEESQDDLEQEAALTNDVDSSSIIDKLVENEEQQSDSELSLWGKIKRFFT